MTGVSPHGQGEETTFAQIAADELGVDIDDVLVLHGDTAIVQYGIGTFGSRGTAVGGAALYLRAAGAEGQDEEIRRDAARIRRCDASPAASASMQQDRQIGVVRARSPAAAYRAMKLPPNTRARPGRDAFLGAAELHVPVRRAHRGHRSRPRNRADRHQALRGGGRLRQDHQSADRRRPGARRRRARARPGALGAGRLRRQRPACHGRADGLRDSAGAP